MKRLQILTLLALTIQTFNINIEINQSDIDFGLNLLKTSSIKNNKNDPKPITDFQIEKYMGTWYEQARIKNYFQKQTDYNFRAIYKLDNGVVKVQNSSYRENGEFRNGDPGTATFVGDRNVADLIVNFGQNPISRLFMKGHYRIVKTDYENYVFLFTREKLFYIFDSLVAWILTRDENVAEDQMKEYVNDFLEVTGLERNQLIFSRRSDQI